MGGNYPTTMSYLFLEPINVNNHARGFYTFEITQVGKNILQLPHPSSFFLTALFSLDTSFATNGIQFQMDEQATMFPYNAPEPPSDITEPNLKDWAGSDTDVDNIRYGVKFQKGYILTAPENHKAKNILLNVTNIGSLGKIIVEVQTNIL